jgi:hypothetical protein
MRFKMDRWKLIFAVSPVSSQPYGVRAVCEEGLPSQCRISILRSKENTLFGLEHVDLKNLNEWELKFNSTISIEINAIEFSNLCTDLNKSTFNLQFNSIGVKSDTVYSLSFWISGIRLQCQWSGEIPTTLIGISPLVYRLKGYLYNYPTTEN